MSDDNEDNMPSLEEILTMDVGKMIIDVKTDVDGGWIHRYFTFSDGSMIMCTTDVHEAKLEESKWFEICGPMPIVISGGFS